MRAILDPQPLPRLHTALSHSNLLRAACAPISTHSSGFCVIGACIGSSSSSSYEFAKIPLLTAGERGAVMGTVAHEHKAFAAATEANRFFGFSV